MKILTHNLGFPRIGHQRELKKALESYWAGRFSSEDLNEAGRQIRQRNWRLQQAAGIDLIPSSDFSFYDHVLDTCALVGAVPSRFGNVTGNVSLETYFAVARGRQEIWAGSPGDDVLRNTTASALPAHGLQAMEMTKWFDTNYHYLVPEFHEGQQFRLSSSKPFDEWQEARALDIETVPVLLGPVTFLLLGKNREDATFDPLSLLPALLPVYEYVLQKLYLLGANWVQLDEPILSCDLSPAGQSALKLAYATLRNAAPSSKILLANYFGGLEQNRATVFQLPVDALHIDSVRASEELDAVVRELPGQMSLSLGVVDGRNVWANDLSTSLRILGRVGQTLGMERLIISPSCSLIHVPVSLAEEKQLDPELKTWLAFADEKLAEVKTLALIVSEEADLSDLESNVSVIANRNTSPRCQNAAVRQRCEQLPRGPFRRKSPYSTRRKVQAARFKLPILPTTTIGSFPQTAELRRTRAKFKCGQISISEYERYLEEEIRECVKRQEETGLDVLVHGEPERTDMVEYFGEQLGGIAITQNGWVQSYGSRCVKPPIIYGNVSRPRPMTVRWSKFAQSLTAKPMQGMLTGPVTILQWSFVRDDQPRSTTAKQLALAIRDEVLDLEAAGIGIIQIDEPALREGLPLRRDRWGDYLHWTLWIGRGRGGTAPPRLATAMLMTIPLSSAMRRF